MNKKIPVKDIVKHWFYDHRKTLCMFLFFAILCMAITLLNNSDIFPVLYGIVISFFVGCCYALISIYQYYKKFQVLDCARETLKNSLDFLPISTSRIESLYQERISELYHDRNNIYSEMKKRETEERDYYTLWTHQIKTPIAAMRLLLQSKTTGRNDSLLLEQELQRIEQYAEMALHYLHLQSLSSDLVLKRYSLYEIIKQEVKKYSVSFIEKRLTLVFDSFDAEIVTDAKWFGFVIEQLLSNSVKYTNQGSITIVYQPGVPDDTEGTFEQQKRESISILDTGIGILEEDIPRIFERGYTGFNGRMDKHSTGIGLYLCKEVLDKLGKQIVVESEVSKGTKFTIYL